jgi:hypothetical protein
MNEDSTLDEKALAEGAAGCGCEEGDSREAATCCRVAGQSARTEQSCWWRMGGEVWPMQQQESVSLRNEAPGDGTAARAAAVLQRPGAKANSRNQHASSQWCRRRVREQSTDPLTCTTLEYVPRTASRLADIDLASARSCRLSSCSPILRGLAKSTIIIHFILNVYILNMVAF